MDHTRGGHLSGKPGNVGEFDTCQRNVRDFQGGHSPGKPGRVREFKSGQLIEEKSGEGVVLDVVNYREY